jgi:hypothetical protein
MEHESSDENAYCSNGIKGNELTNVNNINVDECSHLMEKYLNPMIYV